jgi:hypothetical protein
MLDRLHAAKGYLGHFLRGCRRWAKAFNESFQDAQRAHEARGLQLLRQWLSPDQLAQFDAKGYFEVNGCDSGRRYRIHNGTGMNIYEIDRAGHDRTGWCFVPDGCLVAGDVLLAQKIALETDECGALAVAKNFVLK